MSKSTTCFIFVIILMMVMMMQLKIMISVHQYSHCVIPYLIQCFIRAIKNHWWWEMLNFLKDLIKMTSLLQIVFLRQIFILITLSYYSFQKYKIWSSNIKNMIKTSLIKKEEGRSKGIQVSLNKILLLFYVKLLV
jgi:hypothetical protein